MRAIDTASTIASSPPSASAASASARSSSSGSRTSARNGVGAAAAHSLERVVALGDRGARPAVGKGPIEDGAAEVPGAERDERRHQRSSVGAV